MSDSGAVETVGTDRPLVTPEDVELAFAAGDELAIADLARPHRLKAMQTLVRVCDARKAPHASKVSAATKILEFAEGKPATVEREAQPQALIVNVLNLFAEGPPKEVTVIEGELVQAVEDAEIVGGKGVEERTAKIIAAADPIPIALESKAAARDAKRSD